MGTAGADEAALGVTLGRLEAWDDGHVPSLFPPGTGRMVVGQRRRDEIKGQLNVYEDVLPPALCREVYDYCCSQALPSWGTYVLKEHLVGPKATEPHPGVNAAGKQYYYGWKAAKALFVDRAGDFIGEDWAYVDGIAIWGLRSTRRNQVEYHIDYAELHRLETNVTQPPLFAGTLQVSPLGEGDMEGGDFWAHADGLDHYRRWGYKGARRPFRESIQADAAAEEGWHRVTYKANQGIVHDGDLPHMSTLVTCIPEDTQRVILGFNAFAPGLAAKISRAAPEHSAAFRKRVKLYQLLGSSLKKHRSAEWDAGAENVKMSKGGDAAKLLARLAAKVKAKPAAPTTTTTTPPQQRLLRSPPEAEHATAMGYIASAR